MNQLLEVVDLRTYFYTFRGVVRAVDGISFTVNEGESVGLVGESGSGKTVTGMSILNLIQAPGRIVQGQIIFSGQELTRLPESELQKIRGKKISAIFQNPRTALNPLMKVGDLIDRVYRHHTGASKSDAKQRRMEILERIAISEPERFSERYPHQLSGGMCQRVFIGMALMCNPELVIADEPTTGLDVTVQKQILSLLTEERQRINAAQILITHDLGIVAENCSRVIVLYGGKIMEIASTLDLFGSPLHPYTKGLLASISRLDIDDKPKILPGLVPNPLDIPSGCPFHPRCYRREDKCMTMEPILRIINTNRQVACHFYDA